MKNWGGNHHFGATTVHRPTSIDELGAVVVAADSLRAVGSRHSFTGIADADEIVDLGAMGEVFAVDHDDMTVTANGSMTYARLAELLSPAGLALQNTASLLTITIAGAIATATHGAGTNNGNLATAVRSLDVMTSSGDVITFTRGDAEFDGAVVSLGALGLVTQVTLDVRPAYELAQTVYEGLPWAALEQSFDEVFASGHSVSAFTRYADAAAETLWVKSLPAAAPFPEMFGAQPSERAHHPIPGYPSDGCTEQFGVVGAWHERLPHFTAASMPSSGAEIQSEFFVPRSDGAAAIEALRRVQPEFDQALMVGEIRTVAEDTLWMSPQYGGPTAAFHFTWHPDQELAERAAATVAEALAPFGARPHWGKVFPWSMLDRSSYPRFGDFLDLVNRFDPGGKFRNEWFVTASRS